MGYITPTDFHACVSRLRDFFLSRWYVEVHTQDRLSILAACEDPTTVATFEYEWKIRPLPQTWQMWLEYELLMQPNLPWVFCLSTSYRQEKNPIVGRHEMIFPMFEFESKWTLEDLKQMEVELLDYIGFSKNKYHEITYKKASSYYKLKDLTNKEELKMINDFGNIVFLTHFPEYTSPFWNMKRWWSTANKIDVIMYGMETIWSAEREIDPVIMKERFYTISDWWYAQLLFDKFWKVAVENELNQFLNHTFFPRYGWGIGMTRMIRAMKLEGII